MKTRYIFPCIITKDEDIFYVNFCDLDDCFTDADTFEEAIINAKEVLELSIYAYIEHGREIPKASTEVVTKNPNEYIVYIDVWTPPILEKLNTVSVKKTLTIPKWLNDEAEKHNVNYSRLLQTALKEYLGIKGA